MLKLRVQGTPEETRAFCDALEATGHVLERSRPYANRGSSSYVRVYMGIESHSASNHRPQIGSPAGIIDSGTQTMNEN